MKKIIIVLLIFSVLSIQFLAVPTFAKKDKAETNNSSATSTAKIIDLITNGAGNSGKVPPGILKAPGIEKKLEGIDFYPPVITNVGVENITASSSVVIWNTDEESTSVVHYGSSTKMYTDTAYGTAVASSSDYIHSVELNNLVASSTYFYYVESEDASGNISTSSEYYFNTSNSSTTEIVVPENIRVTYATGGSLWPSVIWDNDAFSIYYDDYRNGTSELFYSRLDVLGNEVMDDTATTSRLGSVGIQYVTGESKTWNGVNFGVVECYNSNNGAQSDCDFYLENSDGENIGEKFKFTSGLNNARGGAHIAWDGNNFGVFWHDYDTNGVRQIYFTRFNEDGNQNITFDTPATFWTGVEDYHSTQITALSGGDYAVTPRVVWNGLEYGVVWVESNSKIAFVAVDSSGVKTQEIKYITVSGNSVGSSANIAWGGSFFGVTWQDGRDFNNGEEIYLALVPKINSQYSTPLNNRDMPSINLIAEIGGFNRPAGIAVRDNGNIYVADYQNDQVKVLDNDYNEIDVIGDVGGSGPGQFSEPWDIAFDSRGYVFVTDTNNRRVQVFDEENNYLFEFATKESPQGIAINSDDYVYVSGRAVEVFTNDGVKVKDLGLEDNYYPRNISIDSDNRVYFANWGNVMLAPPYDEYEYDDNNSFSIQSPYGDLIESKPLEYQPHFIAVDDLSRVWLADHTNGKIRVYDSEGMFITEFELPFSSASIGSSVPLNSYNPVGLEIEGNKLYISVMYDNDIRVYLIDEMLADATLSNFSTIELTGEDKSRGKSSINSFGEVVHEEVIYGQWQIVSTVRGQITFNDAIHGSPYINDRGEIVWYEEIGGYNQIVSNLRGQITFDAVNHSEPAINDRGEIIWHQLVDGYLQIVSNEQGQITEGAVDHRMGSINSSGEVVWVEEVAGNEQVFSSLRGQLSSGDYWHWRPDINDKGHVVWHEWPNGLGEAAQVFLCDYGIIDETSGDINHYNPSINDYNEVVYDEWYGGGYKLIKATPVY